MTPIKTGICAYGMSGKVFHAPLLHVHPGFEIVKIVEHSYKGSKERYPYVTIVGDIEELLSDEQLELIIVNTPDTTHAAYCRQALEAGKHVIVEKPFTIKSSEAETLRKLAEKNDLVLSVFQNRRWDADFLTVRKILEEGMLGRIVSFESHFDRYRNFIQPDTWKEKRTTGAEVLYNLGSHMVDQAYALFGMPESVSADIGIQRTDGKVDDYYNLMLRYEDFHASLKASYLVREPGPRYILHGTAGSFLKWGLDVQEEALKAGTLPGQSGWGEEPRKFWGKINSEVGGVHLTGRIASEVGNYSAYYDNIYETIRAEGTLAVPPEESVAVMRILEAAIKSNKSGKKESP